MNAKDRAIYLYKTMKQCVHMVLYMRGQLFIVFVTCEKSIHIICMVYWSRANVTIIVCGATYS